MDDVALADSKDLDEDGDVGGAGTGAASSPLTLLLEGATDAKKQHVPHMTQCLLLSFLDESPPSFFLLFLFLLLLVFFSGLFLGKCSGKLTSS